MKKRQENIESIIQQVSQGDRNAFKSLFLLFYPRLQKFAQNILQNSSEAEDLVQDFFIQVWNNRGQLNSERHFASFIFTLVKNRCLNTLKRKVVEDKYVTLQSHSETEELYHISFETSENYISMEEHLSVELDRIICKMPERCQVAFRYKWFEGKKIREIAELMQISTTMVDKHLAKGLQIARQNLDPEMFLFLFVSKG